MARFDQDQAIAAMAIQQLAHDWAWELDRHAGLGIAALVTADCRYDVGGEVRQGREAVIAFYRARFDRLAASPGGVPILRHPICNLRVAFDDADRAEISFNLIFFMRHADAQHADPSAVSDVTMACRREADGHWRIARFDSEQIFRKEPA